jgi:hypothetical protein
MKKVFILLLIFIVASCKSDFDKDNLKRLFIYEFVRLV